MSMMTTCNICRLNHNMITGPRLVMCFSLVLVFSCNKYDILCVMSWSGHMLRSTIAEETGFTNCLKILRIASTIPAFVVGVL